MKPRSWHDQAVLFRHPVFRFLSFHYPCQYMPNCVNPRVNGPEQPEVKKLRPSGALQCPDNVAREQYGSIDM